MATRITEKSPYRPSNGNSGSNARNDVDLGAVTVARMAREDTRWFIVAIVILSLILFLALPLSLLVYVDTLKMKAEIRYEIKELKKLKSELKEQ